MQYHIANDYLHLYNSKANYERMAFVLSLLFPHCDEFEDPEAHAFRHSVAMHDFRFYAKWWRGHFGQDWTAQISVRPSDDVGTIADRLALFDAEVAW